MDRPLLRELLRSSVTVTAGLCLVVLMSAGCNNSATPVAEQLVPRVTVTPVVEQEVVDFDEYTGQTEASALVEVRARVFGYLKTITFQDGDFVKEGQTLFTIEPDEYQAIHDQSVARIRLANANLELSRSKLARNEKLRPTGAISQEDYEESVAAARVAEAQITSAEADANRTALDLKYTEIKAPLSGRIDRAFIAVGNLLTGGMSSGTLLTTIVSEQPMYVYFDVDERSLLKYRRSGTGGDGNDDGGLRKLEIPCYVQLADEKTFGHEGKIDFASTQVNAGTGTARLRGVFENKDRSLVSGLFVRIRIPVSKPYQALLIPERALATDQNIKFVYVVGEDGKAERRNVELGAARGDLRIVKAGVSPNERIIAKGLQRVRPGQQVEAEEESAETASSSS